MGTGRPLTPTIGRLQKVTSERSAASDRQKEKLHDKRNR